MKLVSFGPAGSEAPAVAVEGGSKIVPLAPLLEDLGVPAETNAVVALLSQSGFRARVDAFVADKTARLDADEVRLGPPIPRAGTIVVCGMNYAGQVAEARDTFGGVRPRRPPIAIRPLTSLAGPYDPVVHPRDVSKLDYEAELAFVIGEGGRRIRRDEAWAHVAGFMCAQDMGAIDVAQADIDINPLYAQMTRAKSFDTFCPTGPWLVTLDELDDPGDLRLRCWVNGELRQDASTSEMLLDVPALVEWVSSSMTLRPGDIVLTGTPAGCGVGLDPPRFLWPDDLLTTEIAGLGRMESRIIAETSPGDDASGVQDRAGASGASPGRAPQVGPDA